MKARVLDVYPDVFSGIGKFPGEPYKFQLKPNAQPMRHVLQKVPIHLQDAFHKKIRNLESLGILELVKEVTEWVNSFVIMEKKVFHWIPAKLILQDIQYRKSYKFALTQGT